MSELAKLAKIRNWSKYRLMGSNFPSQGLTPEEIQELDQVRGMIKEILLKWKKKIAAIKLLVLIKFKQFKLSLFETFSIIFSIKLVISSSEYLPETKVFGKIH